MKKNLLLVLFISIPIQVEASEVTITFGQHAARRCFDGAVTITASVVSTLIAAYIIKQSFLSSFGKDTPKDELMPITTDDTFASVAGVTEAKEELEEVIDFLKNPAKYETLGARIPHGVLLTGEPGNGKTLLARAVAGEANCPFIYVTGSEFIELYVGVGASRIRDLFKQARKYAPCIIFIDEIDAIGARRAKGTDSGGMEYAQTLNQLLAEMDGFIQDEAPVIVLAATNRPDILDKALLRPGRFDRKVEVPYPDLKSREKILELYAERVVLDSSVDIYKLACGTPGFSGAELANLVNEAAIIATKRNCHSITFNEFEAARDKMLLGKESSTMMLTDRDKEVTAFHEAGHALIRLLLPDCSDPLYKVTIIPRGGSLGVTHSLPEREKYSTTKEEMLASIISALGGRIAEEITFGEIGTGAHSDFSTATRIAHAMVCLYGMSDLGTIVYDQTDQYSQETGDKIDCEVRKIVDECYKEATELLTKNNDKLTLLAHELLKKGTLFADEIYELLDIPARKNHRFT
jgi:cell division protease FtsH